MSTEGKPIRILLADHFVVVREAIACLLESQPGYSVVGQAGTANEAIALTSRLLPDVLLLEYDLPDVSGLSVLKALSSNEIPTKVLIFASQIQKPGIVKAFECGARGVLTKTCNTATLLKSIRCVFEGQAWIGREEVTDLIGSLQRRRRSSQTAESLLTPREMEVVAAVRAGNCNKDIAQKYGISSDTVKHHMTSIFNKLGVSNRLELLLHAMEHDLSSRRSDLPNEMEQAEVGSHFRQ